MTGEAHHGSAGGDGDGGDALARSARMVAALRVQLGAELVETHISWVLLGSEYAWKIKKPVRLPFLDGSDLSTRKHWCDEELRLNRRLAPTLYLNVVPITGTFAAPRLVADSDAASNAIEYAVRMRRFPADALLSERLAAGTLQPTELDQLARRVAAFHQHAARASPGTPFGEPAQIEHAVLQVLSSLSALVGDAACAGLQAWVQGQARVLQATWLQRKASGMVIEGHGDLHLVNAVWLDGEATAFDCIEFDPALRWIDAQADVAFTMMDLLAHDRAAWAWRFLNVYLDDSGDHAGLATLRFYLVYRALVRALVACLRADPLKRGPDYLGLAQSLTAARDPRLLITHGLSGSGKSHVSRGLIEQAHAVRLRSDVERKRLAGLPADADSFAAVPGGIYDSAMTQRTYAHLRRQAAVALRAGWRVIIDAAFLRRAERDDFRALARELGVPFTLLHCHAPTEVLRERVRERRVRADDASEADESVLMRQLEHAEGLQPDELAGTIERDTQEPLTGEALGALAARWLACRPTEVNDGDI
jgi:aminoglycoside phosphotransferase family enzyme/predicted kinase